MDSIIRTCCRVNRILHRFDACFNSCLWELPLDITDMGRKVIQYLAWWTLLTEATSLTLPDLTPNPGLWWYFFTEMFDHFRPFFLMVFSASGRNSTST